MHRVVATLLILLLACSAFAQEGGNTQFDLNSYGVRIEPDKRLIAVMSALEVAGINTVLTEDGNEYRRKIRENASKINPELKLKMEIFVNQYKKRHPKATPYEVVAPYISMAYSLSPAPELEEPFRSIDLPADLLEVLDFSVLVREYYAVPGVAAQIDEMYESYQKLGISMRPSARDMITDVLDYLHTRPQLTYIDRVKVETQQGKKTLTTYEPRERERSFTIVPEMLGSKDTINFLNIRDDYYAIVPPDTNLSTSEVRRAYLQFVLDPLVLSHSAEISEKQAGIRSLLTARREAGSPVSPDPFLAVSKSLVAAVDAREEQYRKERLAISQARSKIPLMSTEKEKEAVVAELDRVRKLLSDEAALRLSESYERGAVLAFYFAEQLKGVEESGFDIAGSIRDWIRSVDTTAEAVRLDQFAEARKRAEDERARGGSRLVIETTLVENPLTKRLLEIEAVADAGDFPSAETSLKTLLDETPTEASRIYYSLGRVSSRSAEGIRDSAELNKRLLKAKDYYENVLRSANADTDPGLISSTYFALGRIYEFYGQADYALRIYDAALQLGNVEGGAYNEAFEAKRVLLEKKSPGQ